MIIKDHTKYESEKYRKLEELKVKIKDIENKYKLICPVKRLEVQAQPIPFIFCKSSKIRLYIIDMNKDNNILI